MAEETPVDIAYTDAKENLVRQLARLDNLRARAGTIITAASVLASFLGGQALADTKTLPGVVSPVDDRTVPVWEAVGFAAFLLVLGLSAWIIKPTTKKWKFRLDAKSLLTYAAEEAEAGADLRRITQQQKREQAECLDDYYCANEKKLRRLQFLLLLSVVLLALQALGFTLDLTT
jgi:hypothetical protein